MMYSKPVRFYCHIISCVLARRGVRHGTAEASGAVQRWHRLWTYGNADISPSDSPPMDSSPYTCGNFPSLAHGTLLAVNFVKCDVE